MVSSSAKVQVVRVPEGVGSQLAQHLIASKQVTGLAEIQGEGTTEGCEYRVAWFIWGHPSADCHRCHRANGTESRLA